MFHIFQIAYVEHSWGRRRLISGKVSGGGRTWPWWMEGNAVYFSTFLSGATGDFEHLYNEMNRAMDPGPFSEDVFDRYLNGRTT